MRIGVIGTGGVGRAIAGRAAEVGHDIVVGARDVAQTLARTEPDQMGNPPFAVWAAEHQAVRLVGLSEAAAHGELVVNASNGSGSVAALTAAGPDQLAGKPLLDVAVPLDFSTGFPPTLFVQGTDSLAEQIQRAVPQARVVKALNTMNAAVMVRPDLVGGGDHTVFVSGDDSDAKAVVVGLLREFGWSDIVDIGDLSTARGTEMFVMLWVRLLPALGTPMFNVKLVR